MSSGSSKKKHYWLVSYVGKGAYGLGGSVHGSITFYTDSKYFNLAAYKHAENTFPNGSVFVSVSYLGEMTEKEWNE